MILGTTNTAARGEKARPRMTPAGAARIAVAAAACATMILAPAATASVPLQAAYDAAPPGEGYDRLLVLDPGTLYTGGLVVATGSNCIHGRGARIDLGGAGEILVQGGTGTLLDIDHCVITNGMNGLHYDSSEEPAALSGTIRNNTFAGNRIAIRAWLTDPARTVIENNIIAFDNAAWGVYVRETYEPVVRWNDAWGISDYAYMKQCG